MQYLRKCRFDGVFGICFVVFLSVPILYGLAQVAESKQVIIEHTQMLHPGPVSRVMVMESPDADYAYLVTDAGKASYRYSCMVQPSDESLISNTWDGEGGVTMWSADEGYKVEFVGGSLQVHRGEPVAKLVGRVSVYSDKL